MSMPAKRKRKTVRVGYLSRTDYLDIGFREGLLPPAYEFFRYFDVQFLVHHGGFIKYRRYQERLQRAIAEAWEAESELPRREARRKAEVVAETTEMLQDTIARELADAIPREVRSDGKPLKLFVVTAPAKNYDGFVGPNIARRVSRLRSDIVYWGQEDERFVLKGMRRPDGTEMDFEVVLPVKEAWRSKYFSTRPDRLIEDKEAQSRQRPPDVWIVDCSAVSIQRPAGEIDVPRFSFPGLHVLQGVTTSENMVGAAVVEFSDDGAPQTVWIASFKDLTAEERKFIPDPQNATPLQCAIIREIREHPRTIGMLEDALGRSRETIEAELRAYAEAALEPKIVQDPKTFKYDFDVAWLQKHLRYPVPDFGSLTCERFASFSCFHAGYRTTQYAWFRYKLPAFILEHESKWLVSCGDTIAGLEHNLHLRGEILGGFDYTQQEMLAAGFHGAVIFDVFRVRFDALLEAAESDPSPERISEMIDEALLFFLYYWGNHDKWLRKFGARPYQTFTPQLRNYLKRKIKEYLRGRGLRCPKISDIVDAHLVFGNEHIMPSGLCVGINHPEMARALTSSLRPQQVLNARKKCHICMIGNFHTAKKVDQWNWKLGMRTGFENGSILSGTEFEEGKLKVVDTAVGFLGAYSHNGRMIMTEATFEIPKPEEIKVYGEDDFLKEFLERHEIDLL